MSGDNNGDFIPTQPPKYDDLPIEFGPYGDTVKQTDTMIESDNPEALKKCLMETSGLYSHYSRLHADAVKHTADAKLYSIHLEKWLSKHYREIQTAAMRIDPKAKVTEGSIEEAVKTDQRWIEAQQELNRAYRNENILKGQLDAMKNKSINLNSLAAIMRGEMAISGQ